MKRYILIAAATIVTTLCGAYASSHTHDLSGKSKCEMGTKCTACNGTGWSSMGSKCFKCNGTGANSAY